VAVRPLLSNAGTRADLEIVRGTTYALTLTLTQTDAVPVDLTGASASAVIAAPTPLTMTVAMPSPATGVFTLSLTATQTAGLPLAQIPWLCKMTYADGHTDALVQGTVYVL